MSNGPDDAIHPATQRMLRWFAYDHLPKDLKAVSEHFAGLADLLVNGLSPDGSMIVYLEGPELTVALRKLLEAKDAAVRAAIEARNGRAT